MRHQHDRERGRRSRQRRRPPAERDQECAVPDQGDRAGRPEAAKVAATKRLERLCACEEPTVLGHGQRYPRAVTGVVRGVLFDVDFTLARPGPELGPLGYAELGQEHGLALDTERYSDARRAAVADLQAHPELDHDEELWVRFTEDVVRGMGGDGPEVENVARAIVGRWEHAHHFELYDDALPTLATLRRTGYRLGLLSNTSRDLDAFVRHHAIEVDAWLSSGKHGKVKPSPVIFAAALDLVGVPATQAVMVGDSPDDDIRGARACGMRAILVDRADEHRDEPERIRSLSELPALLR